MDSLIQVKSLTKRYKMKDHFIHAVNDVSFEIQYGESVGLIGESGSGKSTIARIIAGFERPDHGQIIFENQNLIEKNVSQKDRKEMQMIFQDPKSSLNPSMTIEQNLDDALRYYEKMPKKMRMEKCKEIMNQVHLPQSYLQKYPNQISGGECQRVCIGRALLRHPKFLICDEATSALDVSVQKEIIDLLITVKEEYQMGMLFISHDLALVSNFCSKVIVLEKGQIVESGITKDVINSPKHPYTQNLLNSVIRLEK